MVHNIVVLAYSIVVGQGVYLETDSQKNQKNMLGQYPKIILFISSNMSLEVSLNLGISK